MKITVGKSYEGCSDDFFIPDGEHEFQIVDIRSTKGRVNMTLVTSDRKRAFKTFFLLDKKGKQDDKAMRDLADFVTTALQVEDEEIEVEIEDALGYYIKATVKNSSYEREDGTKKATYYLNRPKRCDGFSDGTESLLEEFESRRAKRLARQAAEAEAEGTEETEAEETTAEPPEVVDTGRFDDILGGL